MRFNIQRSFSVSSNLLREWRLVECRRVAKQPQYQVGDPKPLYIQKEKRRFPDYPYGESHIFKQSNKGLYGGSFVQFGNNVSESKQKTRRKWLPNILKKSLWSETLGRKIPIKMTAKVLKTITKEGGIDNYLTKDKSARIKELGPTGWKLRYTVLTTRDKKENPPHKDSKVVQDSNGNSITVYYELPYKGSSTLQITCGRRKLLKLLFPLEKLECKADGEAIDFKKFLERYQHSPIDAIVSKLDQYGFDLRQITAN
ncbi:mitochondrial 54S ribosomal protein bL28m Ecym_2136 [Eremothecium cymbalariae DBVPG|uniref:Large ribosomal subunit protein bL28m n=1 Tax=Eremothecium cymbalariae (strain CBS 270.75 / DBVPG 7215 / KCTC 17166 / NRRL Y-17582) TaxID=931890 RepID=G8JNH2_ERECY|nr:Hypothetical protein Ecym_2136 [Eremothecium cymbalariae DBVPG\